MSADEQLHVAIQERIGKENEFLISLKKAITDAVYRFDQCDTSTSPEVEESVQLSKDRLQEAISRLKDETSMNKETAKGIADYFTQLADDNHVMQDSTYVTNPNHFAKPSFVDRAKGLFGFRPTPTPPPPATPPPPYVPPATPPPPYVPPATPPPPYVPPAKQSRINRALGRYGKPDTEWSKISETPNILYTDPKYQVPKPFNGNITSIGGTRKRRSKKSRRRV